MLLTVLGLVAWAEDAAVTPPSEPAEATPTVVAEAPVEVTLTAPGEGRRRALRVTAVAGDAWEMQVRRATTMTTRVDDREPEVLPAPEAFATLRVDVGERAEVRLVATDLEGAPAAGIVALGDELKALDTTRLAVPLDARQRTAPEVVGLPDEIGQFAAEALADVGFALRTTLIPLPEEPVGVGATWTWTRSAAEQGVALTERFRATLLAAKGKTATVQVDLEAVPDDPVVIEGADTAKLTTTTSGKVWLDLRRPLPRAADLTLEAVLVTTYTEEGASHTGATTSTSRIVIATRAIAP